MFIIPDLNGVGQTHHWMVPLGTSHLDFIGPINFLKIIGKT
jgi:hypothetical protein